MRISFYTNPGDLNLECGYGMAGYGVCSSLQKLEHEVNFDDTKASLQINFAQPPFFAGHIRPHQRNIWYAVWESTLFHEDWYDMIKESDVEIWTASDWCKKIVEDNGFKVSNVYPHGVDPMWKPRKRIRLDKLRFLHDGEPAVRKGGQMAFDAFKAAFGDSDDVELILKAKRSSLVRKYDRNGSIVGTPEGNVRVITNTYEIEQMVSLYHQSHVLVSPSFGEGFGFPALQGLATGMPVIATGEWAHYNNYLGPLSLNSTYVTSPWQQVHPGQVVKPDFDHLVDLYRYVYDNYDELAKTYHQQSFDIHDEYDWLKLTEKSFRNISDRLN